MLKTSKLNKIFNFLVVSGLLTSSLLLTQGAHAAAAGKVVFSTGTSTAVSNTGTSRALRRGDEIFSGDKLQTSDRSRLQISLADGAYVSVQPNSEYLIEDYNYSGKADGTEKAYYRLLKGGIRAVTGYIGKKNQDAYKVHTAVATIGIRGTGHNTRVCAGDCGDKKDGLYHNTWEGVTTVENDADSAEVPAGRGVFVKNINSIIQSLNQPSGATAIETTKERSEEQKEDEERSTLASSGEQRSSDDGLQDIVVKRSVADPTFSEIITGLVLQAVAPELNDPDSVDAPLLTNVAVFKNADGKPVGVLGFDSEENLLQFTTIDLAAMLGVNNDAVAAEFQTLLDGTNPDDVNDFLANQASVAEFTSVDGLGFGRWADGLVLSVFEDGEVGVDELVDNQSIHFVFGPEPGPLTTSGTATYGFLGGTQSTSVSGATIGDGVTKGFLGVDFGTAKGFIHMDISHSGTQYLVDGELNIGAADQTFTDFDVQAFAAGSAACVNGCNTFIDGTFFAPELAGFPKFAGLEYDIQDTDVVTGVAAFKLNDPAAPLSQVVSNQVFLGVQAETDPVDALIEPTDAIDLFDASIFVNAAGEPVALLGTEEDDDGGTVEQFRIAAFVNIADALGGSNSTLVAEALTALNRINPADTSQALNDPVELLEFTTMGDFTLGRWGTGHIAASDRNLTDPGVGEDADLTSFTGNESLHFIFGD
ncbi:MAG: FecR domain-containing protein, partial [Gammaproteobacteria bacterium]|nr:FecR domain-containing protein [Gammaproteobacteria bacterium]